MTHIQLQSTSTSTPHRAASRGERASRQGISAAVTLSVVCLALGSGCAGAVESQEEQEAVTPVELTSTTIGSALSGGNSLQLGSYATKKPIAPVEPAVGGDCTRQVSTGSPCITEPSGQRGPRGPHNAPKTCAIKTWSGNYLTAVNGGGRTYDVLHSDATQANAWEKFTLIDQGFGAPLAIALRTYDGHYLTARLGGGQATAAIYSSATAVLGWEMFDIAPVPPALVPAHLGNEPYVTIQSFDGNYLTAVDGGGRTSDVIFTTPVPIDLFGRDQLFRLVGCVNIAE